MGGLRTALYNYLFARQNHGQFILRIEDTDVARFVEGALENLLKTLKWVGLDYDEGPEKGGPYAPYLQSERLKIYPKYAEELLKKGAAYYCFCPKERLEKMRQEQMAKKQAPRYDRRCLKLSPTEIKEHLKKGTPYVIRQKIPSEILKFQDLVRGEVEFDGSTLDDQILVKSDHYPTYHLANVVDDHLMKITHVIRGEEWLPSTPKHIWLYRAFSWNPPQFAHLPLLLNPDRTKLSKRQGDVAVEDYLKKGYLKEALINFIALLGWHPGEGVEEDIFSLEELIKKFSLEHVHKGGAIFDLEKLNWLNGIYLRKKTVEELAELIKPFLEKESWWKPEMTKSEIFKRALKVLKTRLGVLSEAPGMLKFFLAEKFDYDLNLLFNQKMGVDRKMAEKALKTSLEALQKLADFESEEKIKECLVSVIAKLKVKNAKVLWPLRVALTGEQYSPGVFEVIWALHKEKTLSRIKETLARL